MAVKPPRKQINPPVVLRRVNQSQEQVVLMESFRNHAAFALLTLFKSDTVPLLRTNKAVTPSTNLTIFPLCDFRFHACGVTIRYYRYERIIAPAWIFSDIMNRRNCLLVDTEETSSTPLAMLYNRDECAPLEKPEESKTEVALEPKEDKHYLVTVKGGHVGKHRYYPMTLPILAKNEDDAIREALAMARVKHKTSDDFLAIQEVAVEAFMEQCRLNCQNTYFQSHNSYDAKEWKRDHYGELVNDNSTGPPETKKQRR